MVVEYDHPAVGPIKSVGQPFVLNGERRTAGSPPPLHGQHTLDVLQEIGVSMTDIEKLRSSGVIA